MPTRSLLVVAVLGLLGCGETAYDVYLKGAAAEGTAERGACKPKVRAGAQPSVLSGDGVATCLREMRQALALYDRAAMMGYRDVDFERIRQRARESIERLDQMLTMVRAIEREQLGMPPTDADVLRRGSAPVSSASGS